MSAPCDACGRSDGTHAYVGLGSYEDPITPCPNDSVHTFSMLAQDHFHTRSVLCDLLASLPKCDQCDWPATRAHARGGARYCDRHGDGVPDYPRAEALRDAMSILARKP